MAQRYTAPVRRGFAAIIAELMLDTDRDLHAIDHPLYRRLDAPSKRAARKAVVWMQAQATKQLDKDTTRKSVKT